MGQMDISSGVELSTAGFRQEYTLPENIRRFNNMLYNNKEKEMPTISNTLRLAKLDDDTKLLIKSGIVNEDGSLTEQGIRVVHDYAFAAHRDAILADPKALAAKQESK